MEKLSDAELVSRARGGDREAFGVLIERYQGMAERVAVGVVKNGDLARDIAQEAMLQAYLSLNNLHDESRFQSWLYGIVLNVCRGFLRDRKTDFYSLEALMGGVSFEAIPFMGIESSPEEVTEAQELHQIVLQAVSALSAKNKAATLMFYYEQLSLKEIAAVLGVSVAAVKGRLHKSRSQLRELLSPVYAETSHALAEGQGDRKMIKVTVADVVKQERQDGDSQQSLMQYVVVLVDEEGRKALPIWVGAWEGEAIAMGVRQFSLPRPLTFNFIASLLDAVDVKVEEVRIETLQGDTFYAVVNLRAGDVVSEIDARPSDSLALAVRTGCPIYASDDVMQKAGVDVPEGASVEGNGLNRLMSDIETNLEKWRSQAATTEVQTAEAKERSDLARRELMDLVFGSGE